MPHKPETIESMKFWADFLKHLTTLSTGSILLIGTFLEKLFARPAWKAAVIVALSGFLVSVIGSVLSFSALVVWSPNWDDDAKDHWGNRPEGTIAGIGIWIAWIGFLAGIVSLTLFTVKNLL